MSVYLRTIKCYDIYRSRIEENKNTYKDLHKKRTCGLMLIREVGGISNRAREIKQTGMIRGYDGYYKGYYESPYKYHIPRIGNAIRLRLFTGVYDYETMYMQDAWSQQRIVRR